MKFTLTYEGPLHSQQDDGAKARAARATEKWDIRRQIRPQLDRLWQTHPVLLRAKEFAVVPSLTRPWVSASVYGTHHSSAPQPQNGVNLFEPIQANAANPGMYVPLVRESMALTCGVSILFLRDDATANVMTKGDLDNRLKVLLDGLSMPTGNDNGFSSATDSSPFHCLMESDSLIDELNVRAGQLLSPNNNDKSLVKLVIDVTVKVTQPMPYNLALLG